MNETHLRFKVSVAVFGEPAQLNALAAGLFSPDARRDIELVIEDALFAGLRPTTPTLFIVSADPRPYLVETTALLHGGEKDEFATGN